MNKNIHNITKDIQIPNRFESILNNPKFEYQPLLFAVDQDLNQFRLLVEKIKVQQGGMLSFILGDTGVGKTTSVYSASVFDSDVFGNVISIPHGIKLRYAKTWLDENLQARSGKVQIILFDGREVTDDDVGLRQFLAGLNQLLRSRNDILFCWPTTDSSWHQQIRNIALKIGGSNFVPVNADIQIQGPNRSDWQKILERVLIQFDLAYDDLAIDNATLNDIEAKSSTIGDYLSNIGAVIAKRVTNLRTDRNLPLVVFVISSGSSVAGEANRLRRANTYVLKAEELLSYSPRSKAGKWWKARLEEPTQHLAYIISLFEARLTTVTPSSVAYASAHYGESDLEQAVISKGLKHHISNARTTMKTTDFYRFLIEEPLEELTSGRKGRTSQTTENAYGAIQLRSSKRHKAINQAICKLVAECIDEFDFDNAKFEASSDELITDVIIEVNENEFYLEFHHLSKKNCRAAKMAAYIMEKLQTYAINYNLVPR